MGKLITFLIPLELQIICFVVVAVGLKLLLLTLLLVRKIMSKNIAKFTFGGKSYPIAITWSLAYNTLPEKFNIELLKLFVDEATTQKTISNLLMDDDLALRLCWFFVEPLVSYDWDKFLVMLDEETEAVDNFREVFWGAVVNFSSPQKKGVLEDMWKIMKRELKQLNLDSTPSSTSSTESSREASE